MMGGQGDVLEMLPCGGNRRCRERQNYHMIFLKKGVNAYSSIGTDRGFSLPLLKILASHGSP